METETEREEAAFAQRLRDFSEEELFEALLLGFRDLAGIDAEAARLQTEAERLAQRERALRGDRHRSLTRGSEIWEELQRRAREAVR